MHYSVKDRLKETIERSNAEVFLRHEFAQYGNYRQISRALGELEKDEIVIRVGRGIFVKPDVTKQLEQAVGKIKSRLGKRVNRLVTIGNCTVQLASRKRPVPNAHSKLDDFKLRLAQAIVERIEMKQIREKSLANIQRWTDQGVWCSAFDEWTILMKHGKDHEVIAAMTGTDDRATRLRQSAPYSGLLEPTLVEKLREA
jgi:hypothetical protein